MGKSKKLPEEIEVYLQQTADAMPSVPVIQINGDGVISLPVALKRVSGAEVLKRDPAAKVKDEDGKMVDVDPKKFYTDKNSSYKHQNHYKKLKKAYLKNGTDGCNLYIKHCYKVLALAKKSMEDEAAAN